jgi:hypothetical protein
MGSVGLGNSVTRWNRVSVRATVSRASRVEVAANAVEFVAGGIVRVMASTVTAGESQKRHGSHAGGTQNHAEYVEIHLSARGCQGTLFSKALIQESRTQTLTEIL